MEEQKRKMRSGIIGQAQVVFGGAIAINVGTVAGDETTLAVGLAELCEPKMDAGEEVDDSAETYGIQVGLVFPDLHALQHFRGVLNELEAMLKERMDKQRRKPTLSPEQDALLNQRVEELDLSVRTCNLCKANGIDTIRDICRLQKTDWLKFRNGGKKSLLELDDFLTKHGLAWGMEV